MRLTTENYRLTVNHSVDWLQEQQHSRLSEIDEIPGWLHSGVGQRLLLGNNLHFNLYRIVVRLLQAFRNPTDYQKFSCLLRVFSSDIKLSNRRYSKPHFFRICVLDRLAVCQIQMTPCECGKCGQNISDYFLPPTTLCSQ